MSKRQRMTWAALDREAAAAPALPGYGVEDQDHPAHTQDDPEAEDYIIGDTSDFAEDVHPGPYGDSGPPALPGYGVEDQDHPAHQGQVGRQASLMEMVRRKSAKCLRLAKATLGKKASWDAIEDQAFTFMSMDDDALDASLSRLSGDFLAEDEEDPMAFDDSFDDFGEVDDFGDDLLGRMNAMEQELLAMRAAGRRADQNDPAGDTLGTSGKSEDEAKKEEKAVSDKSARRNPFIAMFDAFDTDGDGFVTVEDWGGPRSMFASLDTDRDGIIARHEVLASLKKAEDEEDEGKEAEDDADDADEKESGKKASRRTAKKAEDDADDADDDDAEVEAAKKAYLKARRSAKKAEDDEDEVEAAKKAYLKALKNAAKKAEDGEDDDDSEVEAAKKAYLKAKRLAAKKAEDDEDEGGSDKEASKKVAFGHLADFDDDELEMLQAMQYGMDDDGEMACGDVMASDESDEDEDGSDKEASEDDEDEGSDKEASDAEFFATGFDPMGLSDGTSLTADDEAAFREVFGSEDGDDDDGKEAEDEDESDKEASKKLASLLQPQPRKASTGVRTVGQVAKTAGKKDEVGELSKLWAHDPDVSDNFA